MRTANKFLLKLSQKLQFSLGTYLWFSILMNSPLAGKYSR